MSVTPEKFVEEYLEHHGVLGMRWGIRKSNRERAADARRRRRKEGRVKKSEKKKGKGNRVRAKGEMEGDSKAEVGGSVTDSRGNRLTVDSVSKDGKKFTASREMTTQELQEKVTRLNLEKQLANLSTPTNTQKKSVGRRYVESLPEIGLRVAQNQTEKTANKVLGGYIDTALKKTNIPIQKEKKKK